MADVTEIITRPWVVQLLSEVVLARLATANPKTLQPHVVPVWFEWDENILWISAFSSTRKVKDIQKNTRISVLIEIAHRGEQDRAVLLEGSAVLIAEPSIVQYRATRIYTKYTGPEGVLAPDIQSWIVDPENRIIKLIPERAYAWNA